ncbi:MAG TPA: DUF1223 domain-containing protein [Steroidobacteraceae bacterium]|nr:DUF1223 domain-containing protein [Steroidobacteraceae bacterium]
MVSASAIAEPRPVVVELYTSEGCSSCPPAEAFMGVLAQRSDVLPLSFHVDYWDDQGWHDRFSSSDATRRQRGYASKLHHNSVYTPQAIIDGQADLVGSGTSAILSELAKPHQGVATYIALDAQYLDVSVAAQAGGKRSDVLLIGYLREATSHIGRGENSGRTLQEFNIVRSITRLGSWNGSTCSFHIASASLPRDATHAAVLLQAQGQGAILGAASVPLAARD